MSFVYLDQLSRELLHIKAWTLMSSFRPGFELTDHYFLDFSCYNLNILSNFINNVSPLETRDDDQDITFLHLSLEAWQNSRTI